MNAIRLSVLAVPLALAACASQPGPRETDKAGMLAGESRCLRETGSRMQRDGKCVASGRVVTREELERSGGISTGEALNRVSPF